MTMKLGMEARLYYDAAGMSADPTWTELTNVRDLTLNLEKGEADLTTRANNGWRATEGTLKDASVEFEMVATFAAMLEEQGYTVIVELFAPTRALRLMARQKWAQSQLVYLPGGTLWEGTTYEEPTSEEFVEMYRNTPAGATPV